MKSVRAPRTISVFGILLVFAALAPLVVVASVYCTNRYLLGVVGVWAALVLALRRLYFQGIVGEAFDRICSFARALRAGDLTTRLYPNRLPQLTAIFNELNEMATSIESQVEALSNVSAEQKAILGTMIEGVLVVDQQGYVRTINRAALSFLEVAAANAESRHFMELFMNIELQKFVSGALKSDAIEPLTVTVGGAIDRILEVRAAQLLAPEGVAPGVLFVMYDVTRIQRLESVRRDFVANVSHELRTPVTSIKGFVETLLDGAKDEPDSLDRFLAIIARQAERLNSIFNDLLTLARLEAAGGEATIEMEERRLADLIQSAVDDCAHRAAQKGIRIERHSERDNRVRANASLLQQALVNLIDNAIKYSDANRLVRIESRVVGKFVQVAIIDQGPGIEAKHLTRLFERFYRVDQGRSRHLGGTGLGLSIVKHIAHVHGGRVSVDSAVGTGSIFSLFLPVIDASS